METSQRLEEARQMALDIDEGKRSRYWGHLSQKIQGWLDTEKKYLQILNSRLMRTPDDIEDRNDCVKKISMLNQFLNINDTIINEKLTLITTLRPETPERLARGENFVGKPTETDTNGGS